MNTKISYTCQDIFITLVHHRIINNVIMRLLRRDLEGGSQGQQTALIGLSNVLVERLPGGQVQGQACNMAIGHNLRKSRYQLLIFPHYWMVYLEDDVLITVAESGSERVGRVGGRGSVQDHGPLCGIEQVGDPLPLAVRRDVHWARGGLHVTPLGLFQSQGELTSVIPAITSFCGLKNEVTLQSYMLKL